MLSRTTLEQITGLMLQGRGLQGQYVTQFKLSYSLDAFAWRYVTDAYGGQRAFAGPPDAYSVRNVYLDAPIRARFFKVSGIEFYCEFSVY